MAGPKGPAILTGKESEMAGYVIVFNRDLPPSEWRIVGPYPTAAHAGDYAKKVYRQYGRKWVVIPLSTQEMADFAFNAEKEAGL